ncbi:MAG: AraC family transcriptional regulator [Thalassobium sp.]|uniref:HTH araC/xylS-type domain-containing protein n=2 Tax=Thalassolituus oleivorans TaxID=187493 RepID=M5DMS2_9GAMM|nr:MAG: AraC family transcriptional regulator [Oceanospirillales bacterium]PHQ87296.1 MAG: AraC family transcriptional regulator [Thalassobium sp.]CCU71210.1 hypothetical protein TOL_0772 [Thalassolituus oleivorans MIL-1]
MHSLKPHTETLQTLRRLVIRKDMKKATPTLNCSVANIHDTPALLHVVSVLENSQLVDTYPTLFLEYGQILGMQATAQTDNLKQLLEKMQTLISTPERPFSLKILDDGMTSHCEFLWLSSSDPTPSQGLSELILAYGYTLGFAFITGIHEQISIFLPYPEPEYAAQYPLYAPLRVTYNAPYLAMRIPSAQLLAPLSTDVISFGPKEANLRSSQLIVQKAANILRNNLREPPALADLAAQLSLTERTCKRRLQEAGTHYQQLLADLRLEQAHYWLNQRICNVSQAAERLGYSSVANFSKAFKKWSGYSPTHAKQRREPEPA